MGILVSVCTSTKKGVVKNAILQAVFRVGHGIEGDAHAGDWHRQVSLLAAESIDRVKEVIPTLKQGAFAENLIVQGMDWPSIKVGDRLWVGSAVILEITQIGKECHNHGCAIKKATGDCIMPREGLFARVVCGGNVTGGCRVQHYPM